ncbi:MAG TPA: hypothetical protein VH079_09110 [Terriglobales bacterium]|nr:hypothetical protein [Terriglobales bacterium]
MAILTALGLSSMAQAQQPATQPGQPPVKVNVLNVCTPPPEEQQQLAAALAKIPKQPLFTQDFEVDRGRSILDQKPTFLQQGDMAQVSSGSATATWVRIRREFSVQAMFSTVQYSFSTDVKNMDETLVFHFRDPKEFLEVAIEDTASSVTTAAAMLSTNTPARRIKLERFGKSSVVLARCQGTDTSAPPDQSAYEPLFQNATAIVGAYRNLLGARHTIPDELNRTNLLGTSKPASKPAAKKPAEAAQ